jgi:CBS domain containing-hemolysin-like protein
MDTIAENLIIVVLLLAANAFFVAAEFALVKARHFRIAALADGGSAMARRTVHIQQRIEPYLAACQLGITMASLGLGWVGEPTVAAILQPILIPLGMSEATLHTLSFLVGFFVFSSLHIVVGEQVPKTFAIRKPEQMSLAVTYPLWISYILLFPLTWVLNLASRSMLRLFGVAEATHGDVLTDEEIRGLIDVSAEHGHMHADRAEMMQNLFRFDERSVARVMIPRIEATVLRLDNAPEDNLKIFQTSQHSRFPVVEGPNDDLVGVVLVKDLTNSLIAGTATPWAELRQYLRDPLVVPETLKVAQLFDLMRSERGHMACVIDEYGTFAGLVTLEDLLEEIVGDIADETDVAEQEFPIQRREDHWVAHGLAPLADVERATGFTVSDRFEANTLSGLIMRNLQRLPTVGDEIVQDGYRFVVLEMEKRRVQRVEIHPPGDPSDNGEPIDSQ